MMPQQCVGGEIATDNYFQHPERYIKESSKSTSDKSRSDKKKIVHLFEKYKGITEILFTLKKRLANS